MYVRYSRLVLYSTGVLIWRVVVYRSTCMYLKYRNTAPAPFAAGSDYVVCNEVFALTTFIWVGGADTI